MSSVTVGVTPELIEAVKKDIFLAKDMTNDEIEVVLNQFVDELSSIKGILLLLDNLDYFNF